MRTLLFGLLTLSIACGEKAAVEEADISGLTGDFDAGEILYNADCAACHGADADGGSGPSLIGEDAEEYVEVLAEGEGDMPAFPDYTGQDIVDVIAYVEGL